MEKITTEKSNYSRFQVVKYEVLLFFSLWIILILFSLQGIDLTDTGYHLTLQNELIDNIKDNFFSDSRFFFLTNIVGGLWLHLLPNPSLLWAYIGGGLICSLTGLFTYKSLITLFPNKPAREIFIVTFTSSLFISSINSRYIHYYTFPSLILSITLYLLIIIYFTNAKEIYKKIFSFILGLLLLLIAASRVTMIFSVSAIILYFYLSHREKTIRNFIHLLTGFCFGVITFLTLLFTNELSLIKTINDFYPQGNDRIHNIFTLFKNSIPDFFLIVGIIITLIIIYYMYTQFFKTVLHRYQFLIINVSFLYILLFYEMFFELFHNNWYSQSVFLIMGGLIFYGVFSSINSYFSKDNKLIQLNLFYLLTIIIVITSTFGSYTGLAKIVYTFWLPLPFTIIMIGSYSLNRNDRFEQKIYTLMIIGMLILSFFSLVIYVYHDRPRETLIQPFTHPSLFLTFSKPERVKAIDELLFEMDHINATGKKVLAINCIPLIYYLSHTVPAYSETPWPIYSDVENIKKWQYDIERKDLLPDFFILAKPSPNTIDWTVKSKSDYTIKNIITIKDWYEKDLKYEYLWENSEFIIYQKPTLLQFSNISFAYSLPDQQNFSHI